jgi:hypothetical protein
VQVQPTPVPAAPATPVPPGPVIPSVIHFTAQPTSVDFGGQITLSWAVQNAGGIVITRQNTQSAVDVPVTQDWRGQGTFVYDVTDPDLQSAGAVTFYLNVLDMNGSPYSGPGFPHVITVPVTAPAPNPLPLSFTAAPNPVMFGDQVMLSWAVQNARGIIITRQNDQGSVDIPITENGQLQGSLTYPITDEDLSRVGEVTFYLNVRDGNGNVYTGPGFPMVARVQIAPGLPCLPLIGGDCP